MKLYDPPPFSVLMKLFGSKPYDFTRMRQIIEAERSDLTMFGEEPDQILSLLQAWELEPENRNAADAYFEPVVRAAERNVQFQKLKGIHPSAWKQGPIPQILNQFELDESGLRVRVGHDWHGVSNAQFKILKKLFVAAGGWVASKNLGSSLKARPDKLIKDMPLAIKDLIIKGEKREGFRFKREFLI